MYFDEYMLPKQLVGTPQFMAPEILINLDVPYDDRVDVWCIGCITFMLLSKGAAPFTKSVMDNEADFVKTVINKDPNCDHLFELYGEDTKAKDFIMSCLKKNYKDRPTVR